jgi:uncharacterized protein YjiS (DUF1127 family)
MEQPMQDDQPGLRLSDWHALTATQRAELVRRVHAARARAIGRAISTIWRRLLRHHRRLHELCELSAMEDHALRDIGISRLEIRAAIRSGTRLRPRRR